MKSNAAHCGGRSNYLRFILMRPIAPWTSQGWNWPRSLPPARLPGSRIFARLPPHPADPLSRQPLPQPMKTTANKPSAIMPRSRRAWAVVCLGELQRRHRDRFASFRNFWAVAARRNSSRAPDGPLILSRSRRRMRLRCAIASRSSSVHAATSRKHWSWRFRAKRFAPFRGLNAALCERASSDNNAAIRVAQQLGVTLRFEVLAVLSERKHAAAVGQQRSGASARDLQLSNLSASNVSAFPQYST
jgi:hypothetical protein